MSSLKTQKRLRDLADLVEEYGMSSVDQEVKVALLELEITMLAWEKRVSDE